MNHLNIGIRPGCFCIEIIERVMKRDGKMVRLFYPVTSLQMWMKVIVYKHKLYIRIERFDKVPEATVHYFIIPVGRGTG